MYFVLIISFLSWKITISAEMAFSFEVIFLRKIPKQLY